MADVKLNLEIPELVEGEEDATERQIQFIRALLSETESSGFPEEVLLQLGKWQASSVIRQLQDFKKQLRGELPVSSSKIAGLKDRSIWTINIGKPILIGLGILLVLLFLLS